MSFSPCLCHTHQVFIFSSLPAVVYYCSCLFGFWSHFAGILCVRTRTWVQILLCTRYYCFCCCTLHASTYVACFVLWNWMDVNINAIILRLHPPRGSPSNECLVANAWYNCCSIRYDIRSEFGISARERPSGKKGEYCKISDPRVTRVALRQAAVSS